MYKRTTGLRLERNVEEKKKKKTESDGNERC